jgi:NAD(P)-dependent dehydrogenase (short-subunit alcohol dehydrogenase family)
VVDGARAQTTVGIIRQNDGDAVAVTADVTKVADVKAYVKAAVETYGRIDCFCIRASRECALEKIQAPPGPPQVVPAAMTGSACPPSGALWETRWARR